MHIPVLLDSVIHYLAPKSGETYIDATFGAGGYSKAILESTEGKVLAIDRDQSVEAIAHSLKKKYDQRFNFSHGEFANLRDIARNSGCEKVDGVVFDVGVSSMQIDQGERGFSFMHEGPLDMRMDKNAPLDAEYIVNNYSEKELADIIFQYGDERKSYPIAKAIVQERSKEKITSTMKLAKIIRSVVGRYNDTIDPSTRTFQALRIAVNDELRQLTEGLKQAAEILKIGGKLVVVTFHSGEDKIVKNFFNQLVGKVPHANRHMPFIESPEVNVSFAPLHKGVITANYEEVERNIRSRSAKLRAIERIR
jgi:16S rRNA (cytosine1402-N4)-methyltransferase